MAKFNREKFIRALKNRINEEGAYAPLRAGDCQFHARGSNRETEPSDFEISFWWRGREIRFLAEIKTRTSPREVKHSLRDLKERWSEDRNPSHHALLALPYISSSIAGLLEETGLSGIDLNGNYVLQTEDFVAIRLDQKNRYKESGGIKNVFRGTSSIVCRYLLHEPGPHDTVSRIHKGIQNLDGRVSLSTVSKVLSALDDKLMIEKGAVIRLLQPKKLLSNLRDEYRSPKTDASVRLQLPGGRTENEQILSDLLGGSLWVWDGTTSAERYATTTPSQQSVAFTRELPADRGRFEAYRDKRFYNCTVHESRDDFVYFGHDEHWASDVQTYLDLMQGDKREREIALDLENRILNRVNNEYA